MPGLTQWKRIAARDRSGTCSRCAEQLMACGCSSRTRRRSTLRLRSESVAGWLGTTEVVLSCGACQRPTCCPRVWPRAVLAGGHRKSSRLGLLSAGGAVAEPVAVAAGGDDVGVVAEPIEERHGGRLIGQELAPLVERAV